MLPNGTITNANPSTNPDLYFALRGGGSSFGIVTRFDFEALPLNPTVWGGSDFHVLGQLAATRARLGIRDQPAWSLQAVLFALVRLVHRGLDLFRYGTTITHLTAAFAALAAPGTDAAATAVYVCVSYLPDYRTYVAGSMYVYDNLEEQEEEDPVALRPLTRLPGIFHTTRRRRSLADLSREITALNPVDVRQHWRTSTFRADAALMAEFGDIFLQESAPLRYTVPDALQSTNVQLVTRRELALGQKNGGNAFGLKEEDGPLVCTCSPPSRH